MTNLADRAALDALPGNGCRVAQGEAAYKPADAHAEARRLLARLLPLALESGDASIDVRVGTLHVKLTVEGGTIRLDG